MCKDIVQSGTNTKNRSLKHILDSSYRNAMDIYWRVEKHDASDEGDICADNLLGNPCCGVVSAQYCPLHQRYSKIIKVQVPKGHMSNPTKLKENISCPFCDFLKLMPTQVDFFFALLSWNTAQKSHLTRSLSTSYFTSVSVIFSFSFFFGWEIHQRNFPWKCSLTLTNVPVGRPIRLPFGAIWAYFQGWVVSFGSNIFWYAIWLASWRINLHKFVAP